MTYKPSKTFQHLNQVLDSPCSDGYEHKLSLKPIQPATLKSVWAKCSNCGLAFMVAVEDRD